jgi:2-(1,2-epoxy-1,2-dihydrophenyl)acetyl-CoA isomerase
VRISLMPDLGGTWFLPHTVGDAAPARSAMLGTSLPAEQAERMGMVWQVVDDAGSDGRGDSARAPARVRARRSPMPRSSRRSMSPRPTRSTSSSTSSATASAGSARAPISAKGVAAFLAKRRRNSGTVRR